MIVHNEGDVHAFGDPFLVETHGRACLRTCDHGFVFTDVRVYGHVSMGLCSRTCVLLQFIIHNA